MTETRRAVGSVGIVWIGAPDLEDLPAGLLLHVPAHELSRYVATTGQDRQEVMDFAEELLGKRYPEFLARHL